MIAARRAMMSVPILALALWGCSETADTSGKSAAGETRAITGTAGPKASPQPRSEVEGLTFTALSELPANSASDPFNESCSHYRPAGGPKSAGGKIAEKRGWFVTSEEKLGRYDAISFVGQLETATSGVCMVHDGNVALFDGGQMVALGYARKGAEQPSIGQLEDRGNATLLIGSGEGPVAPIAILKEEGGVPVLAKLPAEEQLCDGAVKVPNIYGKPILAARKTLAATGWKPVAQELPEGGFGRENDFHKQGVVEVESCSGTGYGFCSFQYAQGSRTLGVTTVGESPDDFVSFYSVSCD
ncbi:hypothetical protein [Sphingopyxis sp. R3-92]|uniref:hypothetical protein n=1 Tax=Sphingopyxis sp. R3-92 TaxID=3158553 RepID=UPI003EE51088